MIYVPIIIANIENDDDRSFIENIYHTHNAMIVRLARKHAPSANDIDDIVNESYLALIKQIKTLKQLDKNSLLAYVNATTRKVAFSYIRKVGRINKHEFYDDGAYVDNLQDSGEDLDAALIQASNILELAEAISELSEGDQNVLTMKYYLELNDKEIASRLGLTVASVRPKLARARKRLYDILVQCHIK